VALIAEGLTADPHPFPGAARLDELLERARLDWSEHRDLTRDRLPALIVRTMPGALAAATQADPDLHIDGSILGPSRGCSSVG
jgi:hypothetical protein